MPCPWCTMTQTYRSALLFTRPFYVHMGALSYSLSNASLPTGQPLRTGTSQLNYKWPTPAYIALIRPCDCSGDPSGPDMYTREGCQVPTKYLTQWIKLSINQYNTYILNQYNVNHNTFTINSHYNHKSLSFLPFNQSLKPLSPMLWQIGWS